MSLSAYAHVEHLLAGMPGTADQILVLCRGYMLPPLETRWEKFGLTKTESRMMDVLAARRGQTIPYGAIMDAIYFDRLDEPHPKILAIFVCRIRKKLSTSGYHIETDHGLGFRLAA